MRKYGKLAVTLLLVITVISSLLPMAFARTWSDVDTFEQEIDMLTGLGFMDGENSKQFFPGDYVTNAELIRTLMHLRNVTEGDQVRRFQDVPSNYYAFNEINAAFKLGYITVPENKMFYPAEKATADKALEIILSMLNYNSYIKVSGETIRQAAQRAGLTEGLSLGEYITKGELAKVIYNSFTSGMMEGSGVIGHNATYKVNKEKTTLYFHNWELITGNLTGNERTSLYSSGNPAGAGKVRIDAEFYLEGDSYAGDLLGYKVDAVITKEKVGLPTIIYAAADKKANALTVKAEDIDSVKGMVFTYNNRSRINLRDDMMLIYNGLAVEFEEELLDITYGDVTFIASDGGRKFDIVLVNEYESFVISSVSKADKRINVKRGTFNKKTYIEYENNIYQDVRIFKNGVRATEVDLVPDSAIAVYFADADRDLITIDVGTSKVEGTVSTVGVSEETNRKMLRLGEEEYYIAPNVFGEEYIVLGETVSLTLDFNGYAVAVNRASVASNYGVVTWVGYSDVDETALVKIFKADGQFETFNTVSEDFKFVTGKTVSRVPASEVKTRLSGMLRSDIIMYGTNADGLLNKITLPEAYNTKDELSNQGKFTFYKEYKDGLQIRYQITSDGLAWGQGTVFVIPVDDDYSDDACKVVPSGSYFNPSNSTGVYKGLKAYNIDLNGRVGLFLYRGTTSNSIVEASYEGQMFVVQKVIKTINKDDEEVDAIVGYQGGQKLTFNISSDAEDNVTVDTGIDGNTLSTKKLAEAKFGDMIIYSTNADGEICAAVYMYIDDDAKSKDMTGNITSAGAGIAGTNTMSINRGYAKYYADECMSLETKNNGYFAVPGTKSSANFYKVSRSEKTIETASLGDITFKNFYAGVKGSEIVVRTSRGTCSEVFIYEN